jgi:RNA polymerase sigma-70 factor (ECF subfamily)
VAEDLTSEVFADVIAGIENYEYRGIPFRAWLFRIARARLVDHWRSRERRDSYHEAWAQSQKIERPDHGSIEDLFRYETLMQALEYLTEAELEVVLLRFVGDLTNREVATIVRSNENAVKSMMRRALTKLRSILESRRDVEG